LIQPVRYNILGSKDGHLKPSTGETLNQDIEKVKKVLQEGGCEVEVDS
jgi:hypothetical protein